MTGVDEAEHFGDVGHLGEPPHGVQHRLAQPEFAAPRGHGHLHRRRAVAVAEHIDERHGLLSRERQPRMVRHRVPAIDGLGVVGAFETQGRRKPVEPADEADRVGVLEPMLDELGVVGAQWYEAKRTHTVDASAVRSKSHTR